jgi:tRNA(His) 5'-end guanylyltransferase
MKANYEDRQRFFLARRTPVIVRVDGKAFHSYTRGMGKPFDARFCSAMVLAAKRVSEKMQGCKAVYIQSDEASFLLTDYDDINTEAWFDYNKSKVESVTASMMTAEFNLTMLSHAMGRVALFDARAFNVPREEVTNYFLWRAKDWERNSLSMYCRSFFSAKQLHGKNNSAKHDMLHEIGKNWTEDLGDRLRNGTFLLRGDANKMEAVQSIMPNYDSVNSVIGPFVGADS